MPTYEITAQVAPERRAAYEAYMRETHIPDLLATGCFDGASLLHAGEGRYRARYETPTQAALDEYLRDHADRLRKHFTHHLPDGIELSREVWTLLERW